MTLSHTPLILHASAAVNHWTATAYTRSDSDHAKCQKLCSKCAARTRSA